MKKYRHKHLRGKIKSLKPKKSILKKRWFWMLVVLGILAVTSFYLMFLYKGIQVQTIQISGNEKIKTEDLQTSAWENLGFKNIFTVNTNALKKNLLAGFAGVEDIKIQKEWFNSLRVEITERKPAAVFCQDNNNQHCFLIDKNGIIYESADALHSEGFIVRQTGKTDPTIGQLAVDKRIMDALIKIQNNLEDNFQIGIWEALSANPLVITTAEQWKIYFDPAADIDLQIAKMNALLKNQIPATARKNLQYIYLQYKDRAYYK